MNLLALARSTILAALGMTFLALASPAQAGVATSGAVLLDPFDPVPEIQFRHFGGYGCAYGCGGCYDSCGGGCHEGCYRHYRRHADCDDACGRHVRDDCDRGCDRDGHDGRDAPPCTSAHCYNAEHYERRWRDGDRVGQEWLDRGTRERTLTDDRGDGGFYGHESPEWHEDEDAPPPPPPPPADDHHDDHHGDHH
ncbi:MAG TPA: hypothetical protein VJ476_01575 [Rhizomicrobium sp.]|nr:hypothetical protein [Rhizomicrobium sp.]